MKISRNQLRNVINEAIQDKFQDPTDDPRFSDTSYSGRPGSYTYEDDDNDRELTGINVQLPFYEEKGHFLWKGKQLLLSDFDGDELAMGKFVEAIIAHSDSQLSPEEKIAANAEFKAALKGESHDFFSPAFDASDDDDYEGPDEDYDDYDDSEGNFGPDMFSR